MHWCQCLGTKSSSNWQPVVPRLGHIADRTSICSNWEPVSGIAVLQSHIFFKCSSCYDAFVLDAGFPKMLMTYVFSFTYDFLLACEAGPLAPRFASVVQMVWDKLANYIYIYIYAITLEATSMGFRGKCPRHHGLCHRLWLFPAHLFCQHSWDICKSQNASRTRVVKVAAKVNCRESTGKASASETSRCESSAKAARKQMPSRKKGRESRRKEI